MLWPVFACPCTKRSRIHHAQKETGTDSHDTSCMPNTNECCTSKRLSDPQECWKSSTALSATETSQTPHDELDGDGQSGVLSESEGNQSIGSSGRSTCASVALRTDSSDECWSDTAMVARASGHREGGSPHHEEIACRLAAVRRGRPMVGRTRYSYFLATTIRQ